MTSAAPAATPELDEQPLVRGDVPWVAIVWNDPVNLMSYVTHVFETYFHYSRPKAQKLMMQVHLEGKSAVSTGPKEKMERDAAAMHDYGLWATIEQAGAS